MKASELTQKNDQELVELEASLRSQLLKARVALATARPVSPSIFGQLRRDIARIKTVQTQRLQGAK
jgi:large subunit ribosomal protein L29